MGLVVNLFSSISEEKFPKKPEDFKKLAEEKGFIVNGKLVTKAGEIVK